MADNDALAYCPHMGLASGNVIVGYVGTPLKYNCSVFGSPVTLAARCAAVGPDLDDDTVASAGIAFPAIEWKGRELNELFSPRRHQMPDGSEREERLEWELQPPRYVEMKNIGSTEIREIVRRGIYLPSQTAEDRAREGLAFLKKHNRY